MAGALRALLSVIAAVRFSERKEGHIASKHINCSQVYFTDL
jgi:hypothetical protein